MLKLLCCAFVTKYVLTRTLYFFVQVSFIVYREVTDFTGSACYFH